MTSTKETHPPARTLSMVRTGASKVEITSPVKCEALDFEKSTYGKCSCQFRIENGDLIGRRATRHHVAYGLA